MQFAYQAGIGMEDAIIHLLHGAHTPLDRPQSTLGLMFFDFSGAFDAVEPARLAEKLSLMQVDQDLVEPRRLAAVCQAARLQGCLSDVVTSSTGTPKGTVPLTSASTLGDAT